MRGLFLGTTTGPGGFRCAFAGSASSPAGRYFLTEANLRPLPARDGVPHRCCGPHGVLAVSGDTTNAEGPCFAGLRRHFEHTLGVNSSVLVLATEATALRPRVLHHRPINWLRASEAQECFRWAGRPTLKAGGRGGPGRWCRTRTRE
jgi:hypothetical protein